MADTPSCQQCGAKTEPCYKADTMTVGAWWCRACGWFCGVIGRERQLTPEHIKGT